jgi:hypothetical protein
MGLVTVLGLAVNATACLSVRRCHCHQDSFFATSVVDFQLHHFPNLKPAHVYSQKFDATDATIQSANLLRFQTEPIHTSLTFQDSKATRRTAVKVFRNIQGVMGDRPASNPDALAREVRPQPLLFAASTIATTRAVAAITSCSSPYLLPFMYC